MAPHSDQQLVRLILGRLPWFSLLLLFVQLVIFILTAVNDSSSSVFALQHTDDSLLRNWSFNLSQPLSHHGFNFFSSFFIHTGSRHFWTNFSLAILSLCAVERECGVRFVALTLVFGHLLGLLGGWVAFVGLGQAPLVTGMSGGVLALTTAFLILKWGRRAAWIASLLVGACAVSDWTSFVTHFFSLTAGIGLGLSFGRAQQFKKSAAGS